MNWLDVAKLIAPLAPAAGSILGGLVPFPGGSFVGQKFGELIAGQLGVPPTPDAVHTTLQEKLAQNQHEEVIATIKAATDKARSEIAGFVDIEKAYWHAVEVGLEQTGQSMRAEILPENRHWFFTGWRPAIGWVFATTALCFGIMLVIVTGATALQAADPLKTLNDAWPLFLSYFGVLGVVVGVVVKGRSDEKVKSMETGVPVNPVVPAKPPINILKR